MRNRPIDLKLVVRSTGRREGDSTFNFRSRPSVFSPYTNLQYFSSTGPSIFLDEGNGSRSCRFGNGSIEPTSKGSKLIHSLNNADSLLVNAYTRSGQHRDPSRMPLKEEKRWMSRLTPNILPPHENSLYNLLPSESPGLIQPGLFANTSKKSSPSSSITSGLNQTDIGRPPILAPTAECNPFVAADFLLKRLSKFVEAIVRATRGG